MKNILNNFKEMLGYYNYYVLYQDGSQSKISLNNIKVPQGKVTDIATLFEILEKLGLPLGLTSNVFDDYSITCEDRTLKLTKESIPIEIERSECAEYVWYEYKFPEMTMSFQAQKADMSYLQINHITNIIQLTLNERRVKDLVNANFDGPYPLPYTIIAIYKAVKNALKDDDIARKVEYSLGNVKYPNLYITSKL